jgi:hypothetical protein
MDTKKILEFPPPIDKVWEEINRLLVMELENQGAPVYVSVEVRTWAKEFCEGHRKQLLIPVTVKIPSDPSFPPELQKKIDESIKKTAELLIKDCGKQMFDMLAVMIRTKIECEKAKYDLRLKSFMHD